MRKRLTTILALFATAVLCIYAGQNSQSKNSNRNTPEKILQPLVDLQKPLKVVCLGNSITRHVYLPDVEWYSEWGMAASKEEYDYCHVLQRSLRQFNAETKVAPLNIAFFERNPSCNIDSLLGPICDGADIIVIRIGENVGNFELFKENIQRLIDKCKSHTPHTMLSGCFWKNDNLENLFVNLASKNGLRFIPLSWIGLRTDVYPQKGDTLYNVKGEKYTITKEFIITHPNDKGMKLIANAIFNAILLP